MLPFGRHKQRFAGLTSGVMTQTVTQEFSSGSQRVNARGYCMVALGLCLGNMTAYGQPGTAPAEVKMLPSVSPYQPPSLAQTIARTLRESGKLSHYRISVTAQNGMVDLTGEIADESQREMIAKLVRATSGR